MRTLLISLSLALAAAMAAWACATADESFDGEASGGDFGELQARTEAAFDQAVVSTVVVAAADDSSQQFGVVESEAVATQVPQAVSISTDGDQEFGREPNPQAANRVIVRNAEVDIESDDAASALRQIGDIALQLGGWTVESNQATDTPVSWITIRVPAERFESAITQIERLATKVVSSRIDSTDFTQEYTDLTASITVLEKTIASMTELLDTRRVNSDVEDILEVQREIANQQTLLETARGRLRFISESAAFSKIMVTISHLPVEMDIRVDREFNVPREETAQFAVTFWPPADHEAFDIIWDFGNADGRVQTTRAIRSTEDPGAYISSPVTAGFPDENRDRYVGNVEVLARSDNSVARGTANFAINVYELPQLNPLVEVLSPLPVRPNNEVVVRASFNEHRNVRDLGYEWSFGDGSEPVVGDVQIDETSISATHSYARYVPWGMRVTLTLTGDSDAGAVRETTWADVFMEEDPTIQPSVFAPASAATNAANFLLISAGYLGNVVVFVAITSPFWLIIAGIILVIIWFERRSRRRRQATIRETFAAPPGDQDAAEQSDENASRADSAGDTTDDDEPTR